jgi:hypothetical protein
MRELQTYQIPTAGNAPANLNPIQCDDNWASHRLVHEFILSNKRTVDAGGAKDYTLAHLKATLARLFANVVAQWGDGAEADVYDNAITFAQWRRLIAKLTDDDVLVNGVRLDALEAEVAADGKVLHAGVAEGATVTDLIELPRPFEITRLGALARLWAVGAEQIRTMKLTVKPSGNWTSDAFFQPAGDTVVVTLKADECEVHDMRYSNVPRLYTSKEGTSKKHVGPVDPCAILSIMETSKTTVLTVAEAAGTIGYVTIKRQGGPTLHELVLARRVARDIAFDSLPNERSTDAEVTSLFTLPQELGIAEIPTGANWLVEMPGGELAAMAWEWVIIPAWTKDKQDAAGRQMNKQDALASFHGVSLARANGMSVPQTVSALLPMAIALPGSSLFTSAAGTTYTRGQPPQDRVPPALAAAAAARVAEAGKNGPEAADAEAADLAKNIARSVPAGASAVRGAATPVRVSFAQHLASIFKRPVSAKSQGRHY